jgi:hypothetical protein
MSKKSEKMKRIQELVGSPVMFLGMNPPKLIQSSY